MNRPEAARAGAKRELPVILAHGLWVPGAAMQMLAMRLVRAGFRCCTFGYRGRALPLSAHAERLARFARDAGPAHYVAHSLGGRVVLEALRGDPSLGVGKVALLGTPARGCAAARRLARVAPGRWLLGESEPIWRDGQDARWPRPEPLGVIAGTLPIGLGRLIGPLPGPNDGVVTVEETGVEGMAERCVLPVSHSAMLVSARVADCVTVFLREGRFPAPR